MHVITRYRGSHLTALAVAGLTLGTATCQKAADPSDISSAAQTPAVPGPATAPQGASAATPTTITFDDKKDGVRLQYTSAWVSKPDKDYTLQLVPAAGIGPQRILFDVPDLPLHLPGMIRLGLIENGYVKDLKETHADAHTDRSADHAMTEGASSRLVESSWMQDTVSYKNVALLIMRDDHVYILSCRSDPAHLAATRADFDKVAASLHWTK